MLNAGSYLSPPNSGLPEFGIFERPKSDKSDFGRGEVKVGMKSRAAI